MVPVIDMRLKFGMSATEQTVNTCIIVVEVNMEGEHQQGALADSVGEVVEMEPSRSSWLYIGTPLEYQLYQGDGQARG